MLPAVSVSSDQLRVSMNLGRQRRPKRHWERVPPEQFSIRAVYEGHDQTAILCHSQNCGGTMWVQKKLSRWLSSRSTPPGESQP